jgi:putative nucleotidyltransferase with HDIG domain
MIASATIASIVLCVVGDFRLDAPYVLILLLLLSLLSECLPVEVARQGLFVTFSMPYIASIAINAGIGTALVSNLGVVLIAGVASLRSRKKRVKQFDILWNLCSAALCSSAGGAVLWVCRFEPDATPWHAACCAVAFCVAYGTINFTFITLHDIRIYGRSLSDNIVATLKIGVLGFVLYGLVAGALAVSVQENAIAPIILSLIPLLALRMGLTIKASSYQHYYETITTLTLMLQRAHPYTHGHLLRVAAYAEEVALRLGFNHRHAHLVREASVMHDLGKIAVDEAILDKPGRLDEQETQHVRTHAELGAEILSQVAQFQDLVPWVRSHHERPDGKGYPARMVDVEIPVESKIIAVADAFDAMTTWEPSGESRSYREPMSVDEALLELERCSGTQFDHAVVQVFREVVQGRDRHDH